MLDDLHCADAASLRLARFLARELGDARADELEERRVAHQRDLERLDEAGAPVALTYNMNILQSLQSQHTFCVTLNHSAAIAPQKIIKRLVYDHPLFTPAAMLFWAR